MVEEEAGITWKNLDEKNGGGVSCQIFTTATEIALAPISGPLPNKKRTVYYSKKEGWNITIDMPTKIGGPRK